MAIIKRNLFEKSRQDWLGLLFDAFLCAIPQLAIAACDEETIDTISQDGDFILLVSGQSFDVFAGDEPIASLWIEGDSVLVCRDTMINKDQSGEKIEVTPH